MVGNGATGDRAGRCPLCGKPTVAASAPFCSGRCADIDLHRWLSGTYAIPVREDDTEELKDAPERDGEGG